MASKTPPAPTLTELMQAMQAMHAAPASAPSNEDKGVTKVIVGGVTAMIGAIMLVLILWVGSSVSGLSTAVTKMSANVDQLQKSITDLQQSQGTASQQLADGKATDARQDARLDAHDVENNRMKERLRLLEGQPPLRNQRED